MEVQVECDVESPALFRQSAYRWRRCQLHAPSVIFLAGKFLVLISIRGCEEECLDPTWKKS
jgi:hypothetical protein